MAEPRTGLCAHGDARRNHPAGRPGVSRPHRNERKEAGRVRGRRTLRSSRASWRESRRHSTPPTPCYATWTNRPSVRSSPGEVEAFLSETGIGERQFGSRTAGDPSFVTKLRNGAGLRLYTVERVRAWMRVNKRALMAELRSSTGEASPATSPDPAARDTRAATTTNPGSGDARPLEGTTPARHDAKALLSTAEAAALLALSASTFKRYRAEGRGPPFLRLGGRVRYTRADLLELGIGAPSGRAPLAGLTNLSRRNAVFGPARAQHPRTRCPASTPARASPVPARRRVIIGDRWISTFTGRDKTIFDPWHEFGCYFDFHE